MEDTQTIRQQTHPDLLVIPGKAATKRHAQRDPARQLQPKANSHLMILAGQRSGSLERADRKVGVLESVGGQFQSYGPELHYFHPLILRDMGQAGATSLEVDLFLVAQSVQPKKIEATRNTTRSHASSSPQ